MFFLCVDIPIIVYYSDRHGKVLAYIQYKRKLNNCSKLCCLMCGLNLPVWKLLFLWPIGTCDLTQTGLTFLFGWECYIEVQKNTNFY